jgi:hypothetical protein
MLDAVSSGSPSKELVDQLAHVNSGTFDRERAPPGLLDLFYRLNRASLADM